MINEVVYILINFSTLFKPEKNKEDINKDNLLFFESLFLQKLNFYLMLFLQDIKISMNLMTLLSNILSDKNFLEKRIILELFNFDQIIEKVFQIDIKLNPFSIQIIFYDTFIDLISNILHNFYRNDEQEIINTKTIISNIFTLVKYLISESNYKIKETIDFNHTRLVNCNLILENPFSNSEMNLEINSFQINKGLTINGSHQFSTADLSLRSNKSPYKNNESLIQNSLSNILENIIPILAFLSKENIGYYLELGFIQILKIITPYLNDFKIISSLIKILANLTRINKDLLLKILDENFFLFCEQFYNLIFSFFELNLKHRQSKKAKNEQVISESDLFYFNECLYFYFFFYSNLIALDDYYLEKIINDNQKINFFRDLFIDNYYINEKVKFEILYIIYNAFNIGTQRIKSYLLKLDLQFVFYEFFLEKYDCNDNKRNEIVNLCLYAFENFLYYGSIVTPKINFIKCEMEKENIPEIINILLDDHNIDIYETAERIMNSYWKNEEVFY